jgi:penicillin-binding protein-related factor A (putative recombinase)
MTEEAYIEHLAKWYEKQFRIMIRKYFKDIRIKMTAERLRRTAMLLKEAQFLRPKRGK